MKKNKKKLLIILFVIIAIIILLIVISKTKQNKKNYDKNDTNSIAGVLNIYGCEFYEIRNSKESGYSKDIYMSFSTDPIIDGGVSRKDFYEDVIMGVYKQLNIQNFRMIDEERNIIVRVKEVIKGKITYTINNEDNYFQNALQDYSIKNQKNIDIKKVNLKSKELINLVNNDWSRKKANLGEIEKTEDDYDIYKNGFKVKMVNTKVANIVFTQDYKDEIIDGIYTNSQYNDIINKLGKPTYEGKESGTYGYKTEYFYLFFSEGQVSIYMNDRYDEELNTKFADAFTKYNEDADYKKFINEVTTIYPDYFQYTQEDNYICLYYPMRGLKIEMGQGIESGVHIYENYQGKITNDYNMDNLKEGKITPKNCYSEVDKSLVCELEDKRCPTQQKSE